MGAEQNGPEPQDMNRDQGELAPQIIPEKSAGLDRRSFLKYMATFAIGAATGTLADEVIRNRPDSEAQETQEALLFRSGEIINDPNCPMAIDGWRLVFDGHSQGDYFKAEAEKYRTLHPDVKTSDLLQIELSLVIPDASLYGRPIRISEVGSASAMMFDQLTFTSGELGGKKASAVRLGPGRHHVIVKRVGAGGTIVGERIYTVDMGIEEKVSTERPISEDVLRSVADLQDKFEHLIGADMYTYFFADTEDQQNGYYLGDARTAIADSYVLNPKVPGEALGVAFHEYCHCMVDSLSMSEQNEDIDESESLLQKSRCLLSLADSYKDVVIKSGYEYPIQEDLIAGAPDGIEDNNLFRFFDESAYEKVDTGGHPYSNYSELFASTVNVLRSYPDEFLAKFQSAGNDREIIIGVVQSVVNILELREEGESVKALVPEIDKVKAVLGIKQGPKIVYLG